MLMYVYSRRVHVYETDLMGIVHHSNYVRYCEEARVDWCVSNGFLDTSSESVFSLTVLDVRMKYLWPLRYGDHFSIQLQVRTQGVRFYIQYKLFLKGKGSEADRLCLLAETIHCSIDHSFKLNRLNPQFVQKIISLQKESPWTETWL